MVTREPWGQKSYIQPRPSGPLVSLRGDQHTWLPSPHTFLPSALTKEWNGLCEKLRGGSTASLR